MSSLKSSTIRGVKWTTISAIILAITSPVYLFVKARFLTIEEFGYISIILLLLGAVRAFEGTEFMKGAIQKEHIDREESSSLFIFSLILTTLIAGILYLLAGLIERLFEFENMQYYLKLVCIIVLLNGPTKFFRAFLEKYFFFKEIAWIEITRQTLLICFTTVFLIQGWGILGFIFGQIIGVVTSLFLFIFWTVKHKVIRLRLYFSIKKIHFFLKFGFFASGRSFLNELSRRLDELFIGYILGPELLGIYHFGKTILEQLRQLLNRSFSKVLFPLFSKLKGDKERLSSAYIKITYYLAMLSFPMFIGVAVTAHLFIPIIFGQQWMDSVIVVQVFSIVFIFRMLTDGLAVNILYSVNKPDIVLYLEALMSGIYFLALALLAPLGLYAIIITYFIYMVIKSLLIQYVTHQHLTHSMLSYFSLMKGAIIFSLVMAIAVVGFQGLVSDYIDQLSLLITSIVVGVFVYLILTLIFDKKSVTKFYSLIKVQKRTSKKVY